MYFIFRRFFLSVNIDTRGIHLRKGMFFQRISYIPASVIVSVKSVQTPLLRLLKGKKVIVTALGGNAVFYLRKDEPILTQPRRPTVSIRPKTASLLLGALCETGALGGTIVFSTALTRIGSILGSGYYNRIIDAISQTAAELNELLSALRISVPKISVVIAVFMGAAWVFSYIRNLIRLSRFTARIQAGCATITHGLITLYEETVVPNNISATIVRYNAPTLLFKAAPIYCGRTLLLTPVSEKHQHTILRLLFNEAPPKDLVNSPPRKALMGHIAVPLGWSVFFAALLLLCYITGSDPILRTILWAGVWICLWYCILFAVYMKRSGIARGNDICIMSARRGVRLYTACIPTGSAAFCRTDQNVFQLKDQMSDLRVYCRGSFKLRLRNITRINAPE